jgi:hypothetical protein
MWIKLGSRGSSLPSRFDRLYHPTELSHFDKFFARPWATPSRLSHEDQHHATIDADADGSGMTPRKSTPKESRASLFDERVHFAKVPDSQIMPEEQNEECVALKEFIKMNGFNSRNRSTLNQFLKTHNQPHALSSNENANKNGEL